MYSFIQQSLMNKKAGKLSFHMLWRRDRGEESNKVSRAPLCNLMGWNTGEGRDLKAAAEKAKKP